MLALSIARENIVIIMFQYFYHLYNIIYPGKIKNNDLLCSHANVHNKEQISSVSVDEFKSFCDASKPGNQNY